MEQVTDRARSWVDVSALFAKAVPWLVVTIQGLGRVDVQLILQDAFHTDLIKAGSAPTIKEATHLMDHMTLSNM